MNRYKLIGIMFFIAGAIFLTGCARKTNGVARGAINGGLGGAAAGSLGGALVGAAIANGDIAASATLGGGIGLPVGMLLGAYYVAQQQEREMDANSALIQENQQVIEQRYRDLEELREKLQMDSSEIQPDPDAAQYQYQGPSLGNVYR